MLKPEEHELLAHMVAQIRAEYPDVVAIYRFGSWGTANQRKDSDIDIALLAARPISAIPLWELGQRLAQRAGRDVDLVDLLSASTVMRAQVVANGQRLFCADESVCANFEDLAFSAYARLNEERKSILEDIAKRGRIYGG